MPSILRTRAWIRFSCFLIMTFRISDNVGAVCVVEAKGDGRVTVEAQVEEVAGAFD